MPRQAISMARACHFKRPAEASLSVFAFIAVLPGESIGLGPGEGFDAGTDDVGALQDGDGCRMTTPALRGNAIQRTRAAGGQAYVLDVELRRLKVIRNAAGHPPVRADWHIRRVGVVVHAYGPGGVG